MVNGRNRHFARLGYKTLIVWESELKNKTALKMKIAAFMEAR